MTINQKNPMPGSLDNGQPAPTYTDGADPPDSLRTSPRDVRPRPLGVTDQSDGPPPSTSDRYAAARDRSHEVTDNAPGLGMGRN